MVISNVTPTLYVYIVYDGSFISYFPWVLSMDTNNSISNARLTCCW